MLVAMADHAALAVQGAQETAAAARHRAALEQLLTVSSKRSPRRLRSTPSCRRCATASIRRSASRTSASGPARPRDRGPSRTRGPMAGTSTTRPSIADAIRPNCGSCGRALRGRKAGHLIDHEGVERVLREHHVYRVDVERRGHGRSHGEITAVCVVLGRAGEVMVRSWVDDPDDRLVRRRASCRRCESSPTRRHRAGHRRPVRGDAVSRGARSAHPPLEPAGVRRRLEPEVPGRCAMATRCRCACAISTGSRPLNDRIMAHAAGEALERSWRRACTVRTVDSAFRIGGDEFAVLLPETDGPRRGHDRRVSEATATRSRARTSVHGHLRVACLPRDGSTCTVWYAPPMPRDVRGQTRVPRGSRVPLGSDRSGEARRTWISI